MFTIGQDIISGNMGYIGTEPGRLYRMGPRSKVAEASGEPPVVLADCKKKPLKGLKIYGKSKQVTTTGAQLLDQTKATVNGWNIKYDIPLEKSKTYTFTNGEKAANPVGLFGVNPGEKDELLSNKYLPPKGSHTFTCAKDYATILLGGADGKTVFDGRYMLNAGSTPLPWEPYTGGNPSPSPDYPQVIESVGQGKTIGINVRGKNLLRIDDSLKKYESNYYAGTSNRIISTGAVAIGLDDVNRFAPTFISNCVIDNGSISYHTISAGFAVGVGMQLTPGQTYTCSFDSTNNGRLCLLYYDANGTFLKKQDFVKSTFTVPENVVYTVLLFRDADKAGDYKFWNIQLESGDTATSYEPYREPQSMSIATPNGLPGIPVSSGGNYTDADGQRLACDEIDFARGVYVQRVAYTVVDGDEIKFTTRGSEFWNLPNGSAPGCGDKIAALNMFFLSNKFGSNGKYNFLYTVANFMKEYFKTPDELNEFCKSKYDAGTPLTLYYALTTPI